ncbi:MAG: hypothetical protein HWQ38_37850 [Nostoc sp. NMS7]|uniref:hypothetical protein n=1 Tax=Nostoc sp. NMS7 TaxID=2815391 RepID=UPI0025DC94CC|nr:hypothetical protein [Nostoc sp. NMS7]MBN3951922.1 hypothetical protein [Nostoc sp. NMS7]
MPTTFNFKPIIDLPEWRPLAVAPNASSSGNPLICDLRNTKDRHPEIFQLISNTIFNSYQVENDGWSFVGSPGLTGAVGAGSAGIFVPSQGARGSIASGATTTKITPSSALLVTLGLNQLAARSDRRGYRIKIVDNGSGGTGKTEEKLIRANTSSSTPLITLDSALSFTPVAGSTFEILSGRAYCLGSSVTPGFKYYDPALNLFSGSLSVTNLPAAITIDSSLVALDELYVPYTNVPGEGFVVGTSTYNNGLYRCLLATAISSTTITGQSASGDANVLANEYRNFQIRIVEDTVNIGSVGQRRRITSHTAGASAVYTIPTWSVTPSANAKFVIESNNDILLWTSGNNSTYSYTASSVSGGQTADSWSTATWANRPTAINTGCSSFQAFGMLLDADKNLRYSQIYSFKGGNVLTLDILDIAGSATGSWSSSVPYSNSGITFGSGTCLVYDPVGIAPATGDIDTRGCNAYINLNGTSNFYKFDAFTRSLIQYPQLRYTQGTPQAGQRMAMTTFIDNVDNTKVSLIITQRASGAEMFQILTQR